MNTTTVSDAFSRLTTPLIADGCLRVGAPLRMAPEGIRPAVSGAGWRVAGPVRPARHAGSVDVFLEACGRAAAGDVLVIDNAGRRDEACVGDLTALEVRLSGLAGMVVWGCHRDGPEIAAIQLPVFSYGFVPAGPRRLDPRPADALDRAQFGDAWVDAGDFVFADADGAVFVPGSSLDAVLEAAEKISRTERAQAQAIAGGRSLRSQLRFDQFLERRAENPAWTLREHLREVGGAIEV
jgi:regulator of RNase E activity RraA